MKKREQTNKVFTLAELNAVPDEAPKKHLYRTPAGSGYYVDIISDSFNLVLSRNVMENTQGAAEIAVSIAKNHVDRDVWLINTYAGVRLMKESLAEAYGSWPDPNSETPLLPNLRIVEVPCGEWNSEGLSDEIETGRETAPPVLVINSFEFAEMSRGARERLARELILLQSQFGLTVVVFSHEIGKNLVPGFAGSGALGILTPFTSVINRIDDVMNRITKSEEAIKDLKPRVHEKQTRVVAQPTKSKQPVKAEKSEVEKAIANIYDRPSPLMGGRLVEMGTGMVTNGNGRH